MVKASFLFRLIFIMKPAIMKNQYPVYIVWFQKISIPPPRMVFQFIPPKVFDDSPIPEAFPVFFLTIHRTDIWFFLFGGN